jgi:3-oxoacyl-[acyl-carrier-protein] synthase III
MPSRNKARIIGLGSYLPEKILTNQDLEKMVDTTDEWIVSRTGMKERRLAGLLEYSSDMGTAAAKNAIENAGISTNQVDLILVATMSPDYITPSTACLIQASLGIANIPAFDIQAACSGFLFGLSMAKAYLESGQFSTILVIASEKMSALVDYQDRNTCVLFGDGAAAAIVSNQGPGLSIDTVCLGADGTLADLLVAPGGGVRNPPSFHSVTERMHFLKMNGKELFKHAVRRMSHAATECLNKSGLTENQVSWLVPHQANERIIDAIAKSLNVSLEKVYKTLHKYGNTSASSLAIALHELTQEHPLADGEHVLLVAFGAGLTWGATLLTKI